MANRYKNKYHRMMHDMNWDGTDDGYEYTEPEKRLRRNKIDGVMAGVCAGIGDYIGIDPVLVRIVFVLSVFFTGFTLLLYILLWMFVPVDKRAPYIREYREAKRANPRREEPRQTTDPRVRTATYRDVKSKFRSLELRMQDLERSITSKEWQLRSQFRDLEE